MERRLSNTVRPSVSPVKEPEAQPENGTVEVCRTTQSRVALADDRSLQEASPDKEVVSEVEEEEPRSKASDEDKVGWAGAL